jgi:hypothetical protein
MVIGCVIIPISETRKLRHRGAASSVEVAGPGFEPGHQDLDLESAFRLARVWADQEYSVGSLAQLDSNLLTARPTSSLRSPASGSRGRHVSWLECLKKLLQGSPGTHIDGKSWHHVVWGTKRVRPWGAEQYTPNLLARIGAEYGQCPQGQEEAVSADCLPPATQCLPPPRITGGPDTQSPALSSLLFPSVLT